MKKSLFFIAIFIPTLGMSEIGIKDAIEEVRPGSEWTLYGDSYENLIWLDKAQTKPTKAEVDASILKLRNAETFPSTQEQLDALFQGGQAIADMKARIQRARNKEPKR